MKLYNNCMGLSFRAHHMIDHLSLERLLTRVLTIYASHEGKYKLVELILGKSVSFVMLIICPKYLIIFFGFTRIGGSDRNH